MKNETQDFMEPFPVNFALFILFVFIPLAINLFINEIFAYRVTVSAIEVQDGAYDESDVKTDKIYFNNYKPGLETNFTKYKYDKEGNVVGEIYNVTFVPEREEGYVYIEYLEK